MLFLLFSCKGDSSSSFAAVTDNAILPADCSSGLHFSPKDFPDLYPRRSPHTFHDEGPAVLFSI